MTHPLEKLVEEEKLENNKRFSEKFGKTCLRLLNRKNRENEEAVSKLKKDTEDNEAKRPEVLKAYDEVDPGKLQQLLREIEELTGIKACPIKVPSRFRDYQKRAREIEEQDEE